MLRGSARVCGPNRGIEWLIAKVLTSAIGPLQPPDNACNVRLSPESFCMFMHSQFRLFSGRVQYTPSNLPFSQSAEVSQCAQEDEDTDLP